MSGVHLNPNTGTTGATIPQADNNLSQATGLDALLAQPTFTFSGAEGFGDQFETSFRDVGADVNGGAPWLLGKNAWIPDRYENTYYGRTILESDS